MTQESKPVRFQPFAIQSRAFNSDQYPGIRAGGVFVPDGYILLNDLRSYERRVAQRELLSFAGTQKNVFHIVNAQDLTRVLLDQLKKSRIGRVPTVPVYLGEAARTVFEFVRERIAREPQKYQSLRFLAEKPVFVSASRSAKKKGVFEVRIGEIDLRWFSNSRQVLVVDDVISSGQTIAALKEKIMQAVGQELDSARSHLGTRRPEYPGAIDAANARWLACSWLTVAPGKKHSLQTENQIDGIITARLVRHSSGRIPPINSVSTFLRRDAKGSLVRRGYVGNLSSPYRFARTLGAIRRTQRKRGRRGK